MAFAARLRKFRQWELAPDMPFGYRPPKPQPPEWQLELDDCIQDGLVAEALELIMNESNDDMRMERASWTSVLSLCARERSWEEAHEVLAEMKNAPEAPSPTHEEYHYVLDACEKEPVILDVFNQMQSDGLSPNAITMIKVLAALANQGQVEKATQLYKDAKSKAILQPWDNEGRSVRVEDYPAKLAQIVVRDAVVERAMQSVGRKAGKGGLDVLVGFATSKKSGKIGAVCRVLREEFGLKHRVDPARHGKIMVRYEQLARLGEELQLEGKVPEM